MQTKAKGYLLGAIAAASYGMNPLFTLPLYHDGMTATQVLFFRYLLAIPLVGIMLHTRGHSLRPQRKQLGPLLVLGVLMAMSSLTLFLSYNHMDAGVASTILFVYPIMVAVIMALCFGEKCSALTALCIALAIAGIALLYHGDGGVTLSLTGIALVMASSLSYAIYIVGVNRPTLANVPTLKVTFYVLIAGFTVFMLCVIGSGDGMRLPSSWWLWLCTLALAVFPTVISFLCTTQAIQYIGSTPTAILGALEPVTAVFFGVLIFGEAFTPRLALGIALIVTAVTIIISAPTVTTHLMRLRKLFPRKR